MFTISFQHSVALPITSFLITIRCCSRRWQRKKAQIISRFVIFPSNTPLDTAAREEEELVLLSGISFNLIFYPDLEISRHGTNSSTPSVLSLDTASLLCTASNKKKKRTLSFKNFLVCATLFSALVKWQSWQRNENYLCSLQKFDNIICSLRILENLCLINVKIYIFLFHRAKEMTCKTTTNWNLKCKDILLQTQKDSFLLLNR